MSISVTGLGSGLDYDTWIEELVAIKQAKIDAVSLTVSGVKAQKSTLSTLEDKYTSLLTSVESFTKALSTEDVFNKKTATSSSKTLTADVTSSAVAQTVKVGVSQLATATTAKGASTVASYVDGSTKVTDISEGALEKGTFSVYVNGTKHSINVGIDATNSTLEQVVSSINDIAGVSATLSTDGKLTIDSEDPDTYTIAVGSSSDTSNFGDVMSLARNTGTGTYSSSKSIFDTNTASAITNTAFFAGTVKAGTFTIGDTDFTITGTTTLDSLISEINSSAAGVNASWDSNSGKLILEAEDQGAISINIQAGTSNFTDIMGLTTSTWNPDGSMKTTALADDSQELGTNAVLTINGTTITSASNTVTSDVSGISGLTLTLTDKITTPASVVISQDTDEISSAITTFVSAFNSVISTTDTDTSSNGDLYGESVLTSIRNKLRSLVTSSVTGADGYKNLASIGITTGAVSTDTSAKTNQLVIDTDALKKALAENPDAVKALLEGTGSSDGVFDKLGTVLGGALDVTNGYFTTREKSYDKQVDRLSDKVDKMTLQLEDYQDMLDAKFQAMDELISSLNNQASIFDSYFNKDKSSSS